MYSPSPNDPPIEQEPGRAMTVEIAPSPLSAEQIQALARHPSDNPLVEKRAHYLLRRVSKTIRDFGMIRGGDRVAVAVSGGKDSLSLLDILLRHHAIAKDKYDIAAIHVQTDPPCGGCLTPDELAALCRAYGVPLFVEQVAEAELRNERGEITCFGCAFQRRKALFIAAHRMGCNRIAFAHHRDDAATTAMLNLYRHGTLRALEPVRVMFGGVLTLIRPLLAVDERRIVEFAQARGIPPQVARCPNAATSERVRMARILRELERECPSAKANLLKVVARFGARPPDEPECESANPSE